MYSESSCEMPIFGELPQDLHVNRARGVSMSFQASWASWVFQHPAHHLHLGAHGVARMGGVACVVRCSNSKLVRVLRLGRARTHVAGGGYRCRVLTQYVRERQRGRRPMQRGNSVTPPAWE